MILVIVLSIVLLIGCPVTLCQLNGQGLLPGTRLYQMRLQGMEAQLQIESARAAITLARLRNTETEYINKQLALEAPKT